VTREHGARRVTRTEYDGAIWFTAPHYGIVSDYENTLSEQELPCNVDPFSGTVHAVLTDLQCPNGLAFSPDEKADDGVHCIAPTRMKRQTSAREWREPAKSDKTPVNGVGPRRKCPAERSGRSGWR
jgi:hypothetical protein